MQRPCGNKMSAKCQRGHLEATVRKGVVNGVGDIKLPSPWGQWPSSPQPLPGGPLLTFMGVGSPQLHHGQVAGGGGAEGEVRGQGYRAPLRRGRGPHPAGHKAAQEGLACREKGGGIPVRQPVNQAMLPGLPSQGLPQHKVFMERSRGIPWPAPASPYGSNHHGDQETQPAHGRKPESVRNERWVEGAPSRIAQATE